MNQTVIGTRHCSGVSHAMLAEPSGVLRFAQNCWEKGRAFPFFPALFSPSMIAVPERRE